MAAVNITNDANTIKQVNGQRQVFRNSAGIPYVLVENVDDSTIDIYKGNSTTPTSFALQDDAGASHPDDAGIYGSPSGVIDSSDIIHIVYMEDDDATSACRYVQFRADGTNDDFQNDVASAAVSLPPYK